MLEGLKPYPAYKESGVPWLGRVPEHWEVQRLKTLFREVDRRSPTGTERLLSLRQSAGLVDHEHSAGRPIAPAQLVGYKIIQPGEIVMNRMRASAGLFAAASTTGLVSPDYAVFCPSGPLSTEYFVRLFRTPLMGATFRMESRGLGTGQSGFLRLYSDSFGVLAVASPPEAEQMRIVRFLGHADCRIHRYIRARQRLIKLLEEEKQAVIHRAVTRGLDPNVRLKHSGVDWLGEVPEHWAQARLKTIATQIVDCMHATPVYSDDGSYPAIRTADVTPGTINLEAARRVDDEHYRLWTARMAPAEGDILYSREGERFGIAARVPPGVRLCISQRMMAFRISDRFNAAYVMWQINCTHVYSQAAADLIGAAAPHVNVERIRNFRLILPPRREQDQIVEAINSLTGTLASTVERIRREIVLLRELNTRLIADVVTGKLDVREAAARLPEETIAPDETGYDEVDTPVEDDADNEPDADSAGSEA